MFSVHEDALKNKWFETKCHIVNYLHAVNVFCVLNKENLSILVNFIEIHKIIEVQSVFYLNMFYSAVVTSIGSVLVKSGSRRGQLEKIFKLQIWVTEFGPND